MQARITDFTEFHTNSQYYETDYVCTNMDKPGISSIDIKQDGQTESGLEVNDTK